MFVLHLDRFCNPSHCFGGHFRGIVLRIQNKNTKLRHWACASIIYAVESTICPRFAFFLSPKSVQIFLFVFQTHSSFCRENEIFQMKQKYHFLSQNLSNYVAQRAWTDFRFNVFTFLLFFHFETMLKPLLLGFQQTCIFAHPSKIRNTICEHNCANCFLHVLCVFFAVSFFVFWQEWNIEHKTAQGNQTTSCKQENHLVLFTKKRKQTAQTQNNATSLFRPQTNNTRNRKQEQNIKH